MSARIVAMASLWAIEEGFVLQPWRLVTGQGFSPSHRVDVVNFGRPGGMGRVLLAILDESAELSREARTPADADADFAALTELRPHPAAEIFVDRDSEGVLSVWAQRYDGAGKESRQAFLPGVRAEPIEVERAIVAVLRGGGTPAGWGADLELLRRQLELTARGEFSPQATAEAFRAASERFAGTALEQQLRSAAESLRAQSPGPQARPLLDQLWNWLDRYEIPPRS